MCNVTTIIKFIINNVSYIYKHSYKVIVLNTYNILYITVYIMYSTTFIT